jgi:imidazole glycerol phosphate synthase glutamine amidotransferase subunit
MIGIVDYGAGNIRSVKKAFDYLNARSVLVSTPDRLVEVDKLVLPGVGSFGHLMERLETGGLLKPVGDWIRESRPFLGICLGLQFLFESSEESRGVRGLEVFRGACRKFHERKVPQIGWNDIRVLKESVFLEGIRTGDYFYFVHSFYVSPEEKEILTAGSHYGVDFAAVVERGRVCAVQFHPEKSGPKGLRLLENWVKRC